MTIQPVGGPGHLASFEIITAVGEHSGKCQLIGSYELTGDVTAEAHGATLTPLEGGLTLNGLFPAALGGSATIEGGHEGVHHPIAPT